MNGAEPAFAVGKAVNHDGAAGANAEFRCSLFVLRVGIGDVKSAMVSAVRIVRINHVVSFWSASISLALFGGEPASTECNLIGADDFALKKQLKLMRLFRIRMESAFWGSGDRDGLGGVTAKQGEANKAAPRTTARLNLLKTGAGKRPGCMRSIYTIGHSKVRVLVSNARKRGSSSQSKTKVRLYRCCRA